MPQPVWALSWKRSWENGMRISTVQPCPSRPTTLSQTPSQLSSRQSSLIKVPSYCVPAALTPK